MVVKRVAVIGAGASGVVSTKICLEQGLEPVCFERTDEVGGLWRFTEEVRKGESCVMKTTITNTSKEMSCFSDFPMPKEFPNFLPHREVLQYFQNYRDNFKLGPHIRYNTEVTRLRQADSYEKTGEWVVESTHHKTGLTKSETFDAVLVASGHHAETHVPKLAGLSEFQGPVVHTHDFRSDPMYADKKVLVVGMGNSAGDVAVELSRTARKVYLSTRKGTWVLHAYLFKGEPWDMVLNRRFEDWKNSWLPFSCVQAKVAAKLNQSIDHDMYALTPDCLPFSHSPFLSDELGGRIVCGAVKIKGDVKRFTSSGVEFKDGTYEDIDAVVMATGYTIGYPFIDKQVLEVKDNQLNFYKQMFHPDLQHQTLAFIGCIQPSGCLWPMCELQARVATAVFTGMIQLPSRQEMWEDVKAKQKSRAERFPDTLRHTLEIDWLPSMEMLADMIGCRPNLPRLFLSDPKLALTMFFGPLLPFQYRLEGPNKWAGAREAILTSNDRFRYPLASRDLSPCPNYWMVKAAEWIMFPPVSFVLFLEVLVVVLLLLVFLV